MALLYKNPAIAKLVNKQAPYRGQWVIYHHLFEQLWVVTHQHALTAIPS
jgi:hypothetical protein